MIGVEFEKSNESDTFVQDILAGLNSSNYKVYFLEKEIHDIEIDEDEYSNQKLESFLNKKEKSYIVFLNVQVYKFESEKDEFGSYFEFLKSNCEMIILIYDAIFVEIYFKNNELKEIILSNLNKMHIKYSYKTLDNDQRYIMHV